MEVSLKTEKRRSRCPVFRFRQRVREAEGLPGMTTEERHGYERRSAPPALPALICIVFPGQSSFSVLRETSMTFACAHFKNLKCHTECLGYLIFFSKAGVLQPHPSGSGCPRFP
jgi:hypothetical protein